MPGHRDLSQRSTRSPRQARRQLRDCHPWRASGRNERRRSSSRRHTSAGDRRRRDSHCSRPPHHRSPRSRRRSQVHPPANGRVVQDNRSRGGRHVRPEAQSAEQSRQHPSRFVIPTAGRNLLWLLSFRPQGGIGCSFLSFRPQGGTCRSFCHSDRREESAVAFVIPTAGRNLLWLLSFRPQGGICCGFCHSDRREEPALAFVIPTKGRNLLWL